MAFFHIKFLLKGRWTLMGYNRTRNQRSPPPPQLFGTPNYASMVWYRAIRFCKATKGDGNLYDLYGVHYATNPRSFRDGWQKHLWHQYIPTFVALYKRMVRSHLDYCCPIWSPYRKGDIEALEKVQKRVTKMIPALKNLFKDRLKACNMSTLHYRLVRGYMIETYKILSGKYDRPTNMVLNLKTTGI